MCQPAWPSGDAWENEEEAASWAELYIDSINNKNAPLAPNSRGETGIPKLSVEQKTKIKSAQILLRLSKTKEDYEAAKAALDDAYNNIL